MSRKNSLQKISIRALSGIMALSCLTPAVRADGDDNQVIYFPLPPGAFWMLLPVQTVPMIQMPPSSVIQSLKPLNERYPEVHEWTKVDESRYQTYYTDGVKHWIDEAFQHRELLIQDLRYNSSIDSNVISIHPRKIGVYKLWGEPGRSVQMENENKAFVPHIEGLVLSPSVKAKFDTFVKDGLSYLPIDARLSIIRDFENAFTTVLEKDREAVIDSFMNIASYVKSTIYEATAKDDYCQLAYDEFIASRHLETLPSQLNFIYNARSISDFFSSTHLAKYSMTFSKHAWEITQRYKTCGLPMSIVLERLSFKKNIGIFDAVYAIRPSATKTAVSIEACEKIIKDGTEDLDPLIRDEIRKDFHNIITADPDHSGELGMFDKTFAFCRAVFVFKEKLRKHLILSLEY